jgi:dimethylaniline monooxygenase (N-oxide forming)
LAIGRRIEFEVAAIDQLKHMEPKRVAVLGAGVSGLATAKAFLTRGWIVIVFEKMATVGGVWAPSRHYPGIRLQTRRESYAFSDFPMPAHYPEFPSGQQVFDYLEAYAKHFSILEHVRFNVEVMNIVSRPDQKPGWRVEVRDLADGRETLHDFDFVVICNGIFSLPHVPEIPGRSEFEAAGGVALHSSQLRDTTQLAGCDVLVVGFGKSALDIAEAALADARSCKLLFRRSIWKVPHRVWGRIHINHFILSRFTELWFPHPDMGAVRRFLHSRLNWLVKSYWWLSERIIGAQLGMLTPDLWPEIPLSKASTCVTLALDDLKAIRDGRIELQRGSIVRFVPSGVELETGQRIDAQRVILATGFRQECYFLGARETAAVFDGSGAILLYRCLINPNVPSMGFNGYNGVGACQLVAEIGAKWLVLYSEGRLKLPSRETMLANIREECELRTRLLSVRLRPGYYASPFTFGYLDQLLRDFGLPPADRHKGLIKRLFDPIKPSDYRGLLPAQRSETD